MDRFTGCLLGGLVGDVIGAVVEGESPKYLAKTYPDLDSILAQDHVPEVLGGKWRVGRFTDDTLMTLSVTEWLLEREWNEGRQLLKRFSDAYHPGRRYGSGVRWILESFPEHSSEWEALSTLMFPEGSFGNGSAMRAAPIGLLFCHDPRQLVAVSELASRTTHSHPQAIVGATLQAAAVALALGPECPPQHFLEQLQTLLNRLRWRTDDYRQALEFIGESLKRATPSETVIQQLGTGISALEAVPASLYCFLKHTDSYEDCLGCAVLAGGDTDTIGSMAAALSGARLGLEAIPRRWLGKVREDHYTVGRVAALCRRLWELHLELSS